jgi:hypothetical protein
MRLTALAGLGVALLGAAAVVHAQRGGDYARLTCESRQGREEFCRASIDGDVSVVRQLSDTRCREGETWRWGRDGIWVREGCRAEFEYRRRGGGGGWGGGSGGGWGGSGGNSGWGGGSGGGWGGGGGGLGRDRVTCQSEKDREQFCPAPIDGDVDVARQLSDTPCVFRKTWNWNRDGIRVWEGCRAEFSYRRRGGELNPAASGLQKVTCQSQKDREQFCPAPIQGDVRVIRNISDTRCVQGRNWNYTSEGVRVWEGCRAEFEYKARK